MSLQIAEEPLIPLRAMAHPVRLRMLSLLTAAPLSATELAEELGIVRAAASYHLRQLADAGLVAVAEHGRRRPGPGRANVRYRHDPDIAHRLDRTEGRELVFEATVQDLRRRLGAVARQRHVSDAEVWLAPEDWEEVCDLAERISDVIHHRARPPHAPGTVHGSVTTMVHELAP